MTHVARQEQPVWTARSRQMASVDRLVTRVLGLPASTTSYAVRREVPIPMRDGTTLVADHYAPQTSEPAGTLLVRCPYGRDTLLAWLYPRLYAQRGYHVVLQSSRGTFGSGGVIDPFIQEVDDGADTVTWLREQAWFTGTFATIGQSYLGYTQWALLMDPPPELVTAVIIVGPHDAGAAWRREGGGVVLNDLLWWCDQMAHQEGGRLRGLLRQITSGRRVRTAAARLPLGASARKMIGSGAPWLEDWLDADRVAGDTWERSRLDAAMDRVEVPVLLIGGWQDIFLRQTFEQYGRLQSRGVRPALRVGPWTHMDMMGKAAGTVATESLTWLSGHLAGREHNESPRVRIFVTGGTGWQNLAQWPPVAPSRTWFLDTGSTLAEQPPDPDTPESTFTYDPASPTPTIGGPFLSMTQAGYQDDSALHERADVLSFVSAPLPHDLTVIGTPLLHLVHSTDNRYADVFVRLSEEDPEGHSHNVSERYLRLAGSEPSPLRLDLDAIAHRFRAGTRIRLAIAGGSHPHYTRNLGYGQSDLTATQMRPTRHVVAHGRGGISQLSMPVR